MKIKILLLSMISSLVFGSAMAQDVEYDDMYFNSKDRAKLAEVTASAVSEPRKKKLVQEEDEAEEINPTDSYSARNVNPEYTSRSQSQTAQNEDEDYFVNDYRYNTQARFNNFNSNYNNWNNNSWYNSAYWGSSMSSWNSPYYGGNYDAWGNPYYNPYYGSGWSSSFGYSSYGNMWNSGWGMNYGWGNGMGSPWNMYGPSYAGYYNSPYRGWYRPNTVIIVNNNGENGGRKTVYGKAPSRGTTAINNSNVRSRDDISNNPSRSNSGGRARTEDAYYKRTWSSPGSTDQDNGVGSRSNTQNNRSRSWGNDNSGDNNSSFGRSSTTPSYSSPSNNNSSSGATRSHGTSSGSGSNGRTRGSN
jgi:hypothetical protein